MGVLKSFPRLQFHLRQAFFLTTETVAIDVLVRQRNFAIEFVPAGAPGLHRRGLNRGAFRCATEDVPDLVGGGCREENRVALEARRGLHGKAGFQQHDDAIVCCEDHGKLFKNPCSQAELNKIVPFGFSLQRQKNGVFFAIKIV